MLLSHPGHIGKKGIRVFHDQRNRHFKPVVNLDKVWTLLSVQARKNAETSKDKKAAVVDVTKSVSQYNLELGIQKGPCQGSSTKDPNHHQSSRIQQIGRKEN
jgi:hypothetical protein